MTKVMVYFDTRHFIAFRVSPLLFCNRWLCKIFMEPPAGQGGYFIGMAPPVTGAVSNGPAFKFSGLDISSTKSVQ